MNSLNILFFIKIILKANNNNKDRAPIIKIKYNKKLEKEVMALKNIKYGYLDESTGKELLPFNLGCLI
jgi:hypothetical protein